MVYETSSGYKFWDATDYTFDATDHAFGICDEGTNHALMPKGARIRINNKNKPYN
ncbi:hypothetical protein SPFM15_00145 [Salmonella phage SPFM15]|nr:hypothetical protein SPFM5_00140 [Salmonella phage SPFM5]VFR13769.1 hypothetical protein SPFM15_00145 [Salmonella phage SPFM15]